MNILVISENFSRGGLETNINTLHNELKKHNKMVYAFGKYQKTSYLSDAKIYCDFHFDYGVTVKDFCSDVDRLVKIIEAEKIDVIQVHPFYSIYQAFFASQLTKTKLIYTSHGFGSLTFTPNLFDEILFEYIFEKGVSLNLGVSEKLAEMSSQQGKNNFCLFPNPIDLNAYKQTKIQNNKKWALVSRLDIDKVGSIKKLLNMLPNLDISSIDIYGDGTERNTLEKLVKKLKLKVNFKGYKDNINEEIVDKYNGVIGLGRVAIEGLAMGYPVLFVGNDKVCGLIDYEIYEKAKKLNFVTYEFDEVQVDKLNKQLKEMYSENSKFCFRDEIKKEFDIKAISKMYIDSINESLKITGSNNIKEIYNQIKKSNKKDLFHQSINISNLIYRNIKYDTRNIFIKNKILIHEEIQMNQAEIANIKNEMNNLRLYTDKLINEKTDYIISSVNSKWIIRNNAKKITKLMRGKNGKN